MISSRLFATCRLFILSLLLFASLAASAAAQTQGRVTWIYDGDTLELAELGSVRLLGIDSPEHEGSHRDRFYTERFGLSAATLRRVAREALHFNIDHVKGKRVTLSFGDERRDRHGRLLAYVYLPDGRMLNELLLEKGFAAVYRKYDFGRKAEFLAAERQARAAGRGMWK